MGLVWRWFKRLLLLAIIGFVGLQLWYFSWVWWYVSHNPGLTSFMEKQLTILKEKDKDFRLSHKWVDYEDISDYLKQGVIAAEDGKFLEHDGVDWAAIEKAYEANQKSKSNKKKIRGGSTITQQLAKNLFLSSEQSYVRKGQELIITYMIEMMMDKERILEIYLNVAEWGEGVFGAEAAAQHYYHISAKQLNMNQSSRLAVMLPAPRKYDKSRNDPHLLRKARKIQGWLGGTDIP